MNPDPTEPVDPPSTIALVIFAIVFGPCIIATELLRWLRVPVIDGQRCRL